VVLAQWQALICDQSIRPSGIFALTKEYAMSEIEASLEFSAAAYWQSVAAKGGPAKSAALSQASNLIRDALAEARIPDSAVQPTLNTLEAPPLDVAGRKRQR
jgi:hypothetical protein